jgi:hypothetical protein
VRVLLYVEGETEEAALPQFFRRWLVGKGSDLEIKAVRFEGVGGYLREFSKRAKRDLSGTYVRGIIDVIDLYRSGLSYPAEAWLLSGENLFPQPIAVRLPKTPPEGINFQNPPATLLQNLYSTHLDRNYGKRVDGTELFQKLDPNIAAARCPHLKLLLNDFLGLAKGVA